MVIRVEITGADLELLVTELGEDLDARTEGAARTATRQCQRVAYWHSILISWKFRLGFLAT